jgi:cbb3-type cytochrome oxidase maturation protein
MQVIALLLGVSISVAIVFLCIFLWAVKDGQYDEGEGPGVRVLKD